MKQKSSITAKLPCQLNQPIFLDLSEAYQMRLIQESAWYILKLYISPSKHLIQTVFSNRCTPISTHFLEKLPCACQGLISSAKNDSFYHSSISCVYSASKYVYSYTCDRSKTHSPLTLIIVYPQPYYSNSMNKYISNSKKNSMHLFRLLIKGLHFFFQL